MKIKNVKSVVVLTELKAKRLIRPLRGVVRWWPVLGLCLLFTLLAGCAGNESNEGRNACVKGNVETVTFCPGAGAFCASEPCNALFQMPPGEGEYKVTSNNIDLGTFPAGETVSLGAFWRGSHRIKVEGADVPDAIFGVMGDR